MRLEFMDRLACPDCGALAQRIGHWRPYMQGGEQLQEFVQETLYITRNSHGGEWSGRERGVVTLQSGTEKEQFGVKVMNTSSRFALAITHWCTNPDCSVAFAEQAAGKWDGPIPGEDGADG